MTELQWPPERLMRLTAAQLLCLLAPRCPAGGGRIDNAEDFARFAERLAEEERRWASN